MADDEVREVFDTFKALGEIHPESLAAYVVSMAQAPSDVLAVEVLQAQSPARLRIVPLFERVDDLGNAPGSPPRAARASPSTGTASTAGRKS